MHLGVVEFNTKARLIAPLTDNMNDLEAKIESDLSPVPVRFGRTFTHLAIDMAMLEFSNNGRAAPIPHVLVVLTDGLPSNGKATESALISAIKAGILVHMITIGFWGSLIESSPDLYTSIVHMEDGYAEVEARRQDIANLICESAKGTATTTTPTNNPPTSSITIPNSYTPTYSPTNNPPTSSITIPNSYTPTYSPTTPISQETFEINPRCLLKLSTIAIGNENDLQNEKIEVEEMCSADTDCVGYYENTSKDKFVATKTLPNNCKEWVSEEENSYPVFYQKVDPINPSYIDTSQTQRRPQPQPQNQNQNQNWRKYGCPYKPQLSSRTTDRTIIEEMCKTDKECVGYYEDAGLFQATRYLPEDQYCKVTKDTGIKVGKFIKKENNLFNLL